MHVLFFISRIGVPIKANLLEGSGAKPRIHRLSDVKAGLPKIGVYAFWYCCLRRFLFANMFFGRDRCIH